MKYLLLIILMNSQCSYAQINLDNGLLAHYPFNGNADDTSGNNNHGAGSNVSLTTDRFENTNSAFEFNGTNSFITIPNSATLSSPTNELSQVAWINAISWSLVGSTSFAPILMKSNSSANAFQYRMLVSSNGMSMAINNWNNSTGGSVPVSFNEWHLLVTTLNNGTVKSYFNGILIGTSSLTGTIIQDTRPLEIGRDVPGSTEIFNGKIDDVRVYNRELNKYEIWELYNPNDIIFADEFEQTTE